MPLSIYEIKMIEQLFEISQSSKVILTTETIDLIIDRLSSKKVDDVSIAVFHLIDAILKLNDIPFDDLKTIKNALDEKGLKTFNYLISCQPDKASILNPTRLKTNALNTNAYIYNNLGLSSSGLNFQPRNPVPNQAKGSSEVTIIIHGTFAFKDDWYEPGGNFHDFLSNHPNNSGINQATGANKTNKLKHIIPFYWTGANDHIARVEAATQLINWVQLCGFIEPNIYAHSHGGNVALFASSLNGLDINKLVLMGTPIRNEYIPNMKRIKSLHNVFSLGDGIQVKGCHDGSIFGQGSKRGEGRTLADSTQVQNHFSFFGRDTLVRPSHSELHESSFWHKFEIQNQIID